MLRQVGKHHQSEDIVENSNYSFNIKCGMAPEYLRHLVPPTMQSTTIYPLRNGDNLIM
jgi:hypothetical protein